MQILRDVPNISPGNLSLFLDCLMNIVNGNYRFHVAYNSKSSDKSTKVMPRPVYLDEILNILNTKSQTVY